ncbi:double-strand break repair protein MRE11 isoform X3 [Atheta coriaria]|uniref:double-strand break repair protein MRE11 isoform X3 n=1 Tax=Dalotia coriaria TaxID=877792 RepID=UPI0031F3EF98
MTLQSGVLFTEDSFCQNLNMLDVDAPNRDRADTFKILIATDIHLGHNEKDPVRGNDSFDAFEEMLQIAQEQEVDFILLGGDLFDANKPTQYTLHRAVNLIRKYTFGDKDIDFQVLNNDADPELHNMTDEYVNQAVPDINFYDPNLNVSIPVFSIHGNHDDPTGMKSVSSLDTLASMGLVNYFGRCDKLDTLEVRPLVLFKGNTQLALYGVGHLADKRFVRLHRDGKVTFHQTNVDTAFQMLLLHQNRANRGTLNYLPYNVIPDFMDLVMWGHEHDCYIEPMLTNDVYYTQPGSTVATSLSDGESRPKHVGILHINQKKFFIEPIPLKRVRVMIYRNIFLDSVEDMLSKGVAEIELANYCEKEVISEIKDMLKAAKKIKDQNRERFGIDNDMLPLIRLVVQYFDDRQTFHDKKMALVFDGQLANPQEIVLQKRLTTTKSKRDQTDGLNIDDDYLEETDRKDVLTFLQRELEQGFAEAEIFTATGAHEAASRFANCSDTHAFSDYIDYCKKKVLSELENVLPADDCDSDQEIRRKIEEHQARRRIVNEAKEVRNLLTNPARNKIVRNDDVMDVLDFDDEPEVPIRPKSGKGSRGGKVGGKGKGK